MTKKYLNFIIHLLNSCLGIPEIPNKNTFILVLYSFAVLFFASICNETVDFSLGKEGILWSFGVEVRDSVFAIDLVAG